MLWSFGRYRLNVSDLPFAPKSSGLMVTQTYHSSAPRRPISVTAQHGFLSSAVLGSVTLLAPSFGILIQGRRFASHRELVSPITEFPSISIWKGIQFTTFWPLPPLQAAITSWISRLLSPWEACWMTSCLSCSVGQNPEFLNCTTDGSNFLCFKDDLRCTVCILGWTFMDTRWYMLCGISCLSLFGMLFPSTNSWKIVMNLKCSVFSGVL